MNLLCYALTNVEINITSHSSVGAVLAASVYIDSFLVYIYTLIKINKLLLSKQLVSTQVLNSLKGLPGSAVAQW